MKNRFIVFLCAALASVSAAAVADSDPAALPYSPAFCADAFTDFVGLNASPYERYLDSGPFKGAGTKYPPQTFFDLGVRHYRTGLKNDLTLPDQPRLISEAYRKYGATAMLLVDPGKDGTPQDIVSRLKLYAPGSVDLVEGPNEVNNKFPPQDLNLKYKGKTDEAAGAQYMDDLYPAVKADPATRSIGVVAYTAIFTDYHLARPCDSFDYLNMHSYQGSNTPSSSILNNELRAENQLPDGAPIKPFIPTECGYNVQADVSNGTNGVGAVQSQALSIPMLLAEYFRHGIKRAYLFALHNADGYGLLEDDQVTKRPSYYALQSLLAAVKDAAWDSSGLKWSARPFRPRALLFRVDGAPETVHTLTLQKQNGEYLLFIWNEVPNFADGRVVVNEPVPATIRFTTPVAPGAQVLTQNASGTYDISAVSINDGALTLRVPSAVSIIRLTPRSPFGKPSPPPARLTAATTENSVRLSWKAPQNGAPIRGYFVYRNAEFLGATSSLSFDDLSPAIVGGLGYTYSVKSFTAAGDMSDSAQVVATTPNRRPDMVFDRVGMPVVRPGDAVRFTATLRNAGDGATPRDTPVAVTFYVDGQYTSFGGTDGAPLAPGETKQIVAGAPWTAVAGVHVVRALIDDIDRVPEERNKGNNIVDRTLIVGPAGAGAIDGSADPAPGAVDLSAEGTEDWAAWGLGGKTACNRKAGGAVISAIGFTGDGYYDATPGCPVALSWTNGAPLHSAADCHSGLWLNGAGHGFAFDVAADPFPRVLRIYAAGLEGAGCVLDAHLSDGSAPDYVSDTFNGNLATPFAPVPDGFSGVYTIRYHASSPGQTLHVTWTLKSEPNRFLGQARLQAATVARE